MTWPRNPYDFSTPARKEVFAGRDREKSAILRFLSSIGESTTSHLLIHGRRGNGKTSLLGELDELARDQGFLTARLTLDDSSCSEPLFVPEVIGAVANAVIAAGALGGAGGDYDRAIERAAMGQADDSAS